MQLDNAQVLEKVVLINLDVHTWSGRKKLRPEDIKGDIPPKKLASLGSKRIVDPKKVATFESLKRQAERLLGSVGIRVMRTYAVPLDKVKELIDGLNEIRGEFEDSKAKFLSSYHTSVEAWIAEQNEWGDIIRSAITPVGDIRDQLSFGWQVFGVQPTGLDDSGLEQEISGMAGKLFDEISREAARVFEESFLMKTKVGQRALRPIRSIQEKLKGLSFLDGRAAALSDFLDDTLNALPKVGSIEGEHLNKLFGLLIVLSSPAKVSQYGQDLLDGKCITDGELIALSGLDEIEQEDTDEAEKGSTGDLLNAADEPHASIPEVVVQKPASAPAAAPSWF